jgi:hypothetical protein
LLEQAGLDSGQVTPWNAYPWYINRAPREVELRAGTTPLARLLSLLASVRVVLLLGREARRAWTIFSQAHPQLAADLPAVDTRHTSARRSSPRTPNGASDGVPSSSRRSRPSQRSFAAPQPCHG